jgi:hypothetical protein
MNRTVVAFVALIAVLVSSNALAAACDHRPSKLVGKTIAGTVGGASGTTAVAGSALHAAGYYTIVNATTGATMLGSTATGSSAAGTVGIMAGTGSGIGAAAAVLMSPLVLIPAAVTGVAIAAYEGTCYFKDRKGKKDKLTSSSKR